MIHGVLKLSDYFDFPNGSRDDSRHHALLASSELRLLGKKELQFPELVFKQFFASEYIESSSHLSKNWKVLLFSNSSHFAHQALVSFDEKPSSF